MAAKAKKATGPPVEVLIRDALVRVATSEAPLKLTGKGDPPALFPSMTAAAKEAFARMKSESLLVEDGAGKSAVVNLTAAGFLFVLPHVPDDAVGRAGKAVAQRLPTSERAGFLNSLIGKNPLAAAELLPLYDEAIAAEKAEAEERIAAAARRREREDANLRAIERWKALTEQRRQQRIEALRGELVAEGEPALAAGANDSHAKPQPCPPPPAVPAEDGPFRRQMTRRLVSSWLQQWQGNRQEGRQAMETALGGMSGIRRVGNVGETAAFDPAIHECERAVALGEAVRIIRPGWTLIEEEGPYTLLKVLVE